MATAVEKDVGHRATQKAYWTENSLEATVEAMMLDSQAASIDKLERPEVCWARARVLMYFVFMVTFESPWCITESAHCHTQW